jgi:hypothetical protein
VTQVPLLTELGARVLTEDELFHLILEEGMPTITRLVPLARQQGTQIPSVLPTADWCDSRSLAANTAEAITPPVDADGNKATIFRINASAGPLYINFNATAVIPTTDTTNGTSAIMIHAELAPVIVVAPLATDTLSIICGANSIVTLEAWN